jgi:hypothetical protein
MTELATAFVVFLALLVFDVYGWYSFCMNPAISEDVDDFEEMFHRNKFNIFRSKRMIPLVLLASSFALMNYIEGINQEIEIFLYTFFAILYAVLAFVEFRAYIRAFIESENGLQN